MGMEFKLFNDSYLERPQTAILPPGWVGGGGLVPYLFLALPPFRADLTSCRAGANTAVEHIDVAGPWSAMPASGVTFEISIEMAMENMKNIGI